jgi:hypothetical protein
MNISIISQFSFETKLYLFFINISVFNIASLSKFALISIEVKDRRRPCASGVIEKSVRAF